MVHCSHKKIVPSFFISGHKSFLGFFFLHHAYNNAVVHVFMKILKESIHDDPNKLIIGFRIVWFMKGKVHQRREPILIAVSTIYI